MATKISDFTDMLGITNSRSNEPTLPAKPVFSPEGEGERKVLFEWDALSTTHTKTKSSQKLNRTFLIIGSVLGLLLVAIREYLLIALIASIVFIKHILDASPARSVHHKLMNHGIDYSGQFYGWGELKHFFFKDSDGSTVLCVDTYDRLPGRLFLLINTGDKEKVKEIVGKYITFLQEAPTTFVDKIYEAAARKLPTDA